MPDHQCPECHGSRTLDGITDEASAAAWLDCTTCSAIPLADRGDYRGLGVNEYGTPVSVHICASCGDPFTVCPPFQGDYKGCLAPLCPSYDIERDVEYLLAAGQRLMRDDEGGVA